MSSYLITWKLDHSLYDERGFYPDALCDQVMDMEREWRREQPTKHELRRLFGLVRKVEGTSRLDRQTIWEKVDMLDLVRRYCGEPKRVGAVYMATCPLHKDTRPSMTVWPDKKRWWCFPCNKGGTPFCLIMECEGLDFVSSMHFLNQMYL